VSVEPKLHGCQSMTGALQRVLVHRPERIETWRKCAWRGEPHRARIAAEHDAFCTLLADSGAEIVIAESPAASVDAIYTYDPALVADAGAVLLRPGKEIRRPEVEAMESDLEAAGVPILGRLDAPAIAEGGDTLWLDERTLLVGRGYRTDEGGADGLAALLPIVELVVYDLPHWHGRGEVMHLMSLLSPLAPDLVVAYPPLLPVRLAELLADREIEIVAVPDEEFESMGPNVLALAPRVALAVEGNPETRNRMERAGVEVLVYRGEELSKGDGGPTCLTRPLLRAG